MASSLTAFVGETEHMQFAPSKLPLRYSDGDISHEAFLADIRGTLARGEVLQARLSALPGGVYLFGHSHSQWHGWFGNHLLLNPGSCGEPLDCGEFGACYSLLTLDNGSATVEERRVPYDRERLIARVRESDQYRAARVWSELTIGIGAPDANTTCFFFAMPSSMPGESATSAGRLPRIRGKRRLKSGRKLKTRTGEQSRTWNKKSKAAFCEERLLCFCRGQEKPRGNARLGTNRSV